MEELTLETTPRICRMCALQTDNFFGIYDEEGYKLDIESKIRKYVNITISQKDSLPKNICWECYTELERFVYFVDRSVNAQLSLCDLFPVFDDALNGDLFPEDSLYDTDSGLNSLLDFNAQTANYSSHECLYDKDTIESFLQDNKNEVFGEDILNQSLEIVEEKEVKQYKEGVKQCEEEVKRCDEGVKQYEEDVDDKNKDPDFVLNTNEGDKRKRPKRSRKRKSANKKPPFIKMPEEEMVEALDDIKKTYFSHMPWLCPYCQEKFDSFADLCDHQKRQHPSDMSRMLCSFCYKTFHKKQAFATHMKGHFINGATCHHCGKVFANKTAVQSHLLVHSKTKPFICNKCGKGFRQPCSLFNHSKTHLPTESKYKWKCDVCGKRFSAKSNMFVHAKIHANERNFQCDVCGLKFIQKGNLTAHVQLHALEKKFECDVCHKKFAQGDNLKRHKLVHTGTKDFACDICGKSFRLSKTLADHMRVHTGDLPFKCDVCQRSFRHRTSLTIHNRTHTGERPYRCSVCHQGFGNLSNYKKHVARKHDNVENVAVTTPAPSVATAVKNDPYPYNGGEVSEASSSCSSSHHHAEQNGNSTSCSNLELEDAVKFYEPICEDGSETLEDFYPIQDISDSIGDLDYYEALAPLVESEGGNFFPEDFA